MPATLVADCPRCRANHVTFDVFANQHVGFRHDWQRVSEVFSVCRVCHKTSVFVCVAEEYEDRNKAEIKVNNHLTNYGGNLNDLLIVDGIIGLKDQNAPPAPAHLPDAVESAFREGAISLTVGCWNAAAAMFRSCVDLASKEKLPEGEHEGLNTGVKRNLAARLKWLFENDFLPQDLEELSSCIKDNGNDGVHDLSLTKDDAEDLLDFTTALLERMYAEPKKLALMKERREARRSK